MELLDGIVRARQIQFKFGCVCPGKENWLLPTSPQVQLTDVVSRERPRCPHLWAKLARPRLDAQAQLASEGIREGPRRPHQAIQGRARRGRSLQEEAEGGTTHRQREGGAARRSREVRFVRAGRGKEMRGLVDGGQPRRTWGRRGTAPDLGTKGRGGVGVGAAQ
jgi:hypothetical protein